MTQSKELDGYDEPISNPINFDESAGPGNIPAETLKGGVEHE